MMKPPAGKVLITGSSGMLGIDLSQELRSDYLTIGADLTENDKAPVSSFYKCDITDAKNVLDLFSKIRPDAVVHSAAWTDVDGCELDRDKAYRVNADGTMNVAMACGKLDAAIVYISTDFVFDGKSRRPYREDDRPGPLNIYGDSKLKGEEAVKKIAKKYFIVRTSWLYGRHGKNFVDTILLKAKAPQTLKVVDDQSGSPTYTKDLAQAIHMLLKTALQGQGSRVRGQGVYHVSNSGSVSWRDYAKEIIKTAGLKTEVAPISSKELDAPAKRPAMSVLDNSKFIGFTGYRMRGWKDALKEYLEVKKVS